VVAHNLAFDAPFLAHQFRQLGVDVPLGVETGLCTMTLAATYLPHAGRSLAACCVAASVPLDNAHCALDDTRAAALLLRRYIRTAGTPLPWTALLRRGAEAQWPHIPMFGPFAPALRRGLPVVAESFLGRLVETLPRVVTPPQADRYLAVLDRALIDGQISDTEADALVDLARRLGLSRTDVAMLHYDYLLALGAAARTDSAAAGTETSDADITELHAVATMLGLPGTAVDRVLRPLSTGVPRQAARRFTLSPGDTVVFTGQATEPREELERRAGAAGLRVAPAVGRETTLLIAADVDTMSVKARAARDYDVPIVSAATFDRFLAAMPEV
jgi:DNA polymerase-3 subunit epsilon